MRPPTNADREAKDRWMPTIRETLANAVAPTGRYIPRPRTPYIDVEGVELEPPSTNGTSDV
jgi:hypothetical protein